MTAATFHIMCYHYYAPDPTVGHYKFSAVCPSVCLSSASTELENGKAYRRSKFGRMEAHDTGNQ